MLKNSLLSLAIATALVSSAFASGFGSPVTVTVTAFSADSALATGTLTSASNGGQSLGTAHIFTRGGTASADFGTQHSGAATGFGSSKTTGAGLGGLDITVNHGNVLALAGSTQGQTSLGNGYGSPYSTPASIAVGDGFADVSGTSGPASFSSTSVNNQLATSVANWFIVPASTINGASSVGGAITTH